MLPEPPPAPQPARAPALPPAPTLREIEAAFRQGALDGETAAAEALIEPRGLAADARIGIYVNNIVASLTEVLENTFPAIRRHVGPENFAVLAGAFLRAHPPASPCLDRFGGGLADFLDGFAPARDNLPWLPDLARLEWAIHDSYFAADAAPFDPAGLAGVAPDEVGALRFAAHPAARAVASAYPVHAIWQAPALDEVAAAGHQVLGARPDVQVDVIPVEPGPFILFSALAAGEPLADAAQAATQAAADDAEDDADFDLEAAFALLIQRGVLMAGAPGR